MERGLVVPSIGQTVVDYAKVVYENLRVTLKYTIFCFFSMIEVEFCLLGTFLVNVFNSGIISNLYECSTSNITFFSRFQNIRNYSCT